MRIAAGVRNERPRESSVREYSGVVSAFSEVPELAARAALWSSVGDGR